MQVFIDGEFYSKENAKISVFDHGFLYGDGVFEGIRVYNNRVFKLKEHIDRLFDSAKAIMLKIPLSKQELIEKTLETCKRSEVYDSGYIRLIVSRGVGDLGLDVRKCKEPSIVIIASHISLYPDELYEKGLKIVTVPTRRNIPEALSPAIKSLNYLNNVLAKIEAVNAGVEEAIMMNNEGYVSECTGDNIFIIKGNQLITPAPHLGILNGITRTTIMALAKKAKLEVLEKTLTRYDLYISDECFLTGSAAEVIPVISIDGRKINEGLVGEHTKKLITLFREHVKKDGEPIR